MDPEATMDQILQYLTEANYEEAFYSCMELQNWLKKGGFGITGTYAINSVDLGVWCQVTKKLCKRAAFKP